MRIGIDARVAKWHIGSGLGNYTDRIIENLNKIDSMNEYLLLFPNASGSDRLCSLNIGSVREERKGDFWNLMYTTSWGIHEDIDVFHNTVNGIGLPKEIKGKLIVTLHDLIPYVMPETVDKPHLEYVLRHTPSVIERADMIITVSKYSKKDIINYLHVPEEKIKVIYHGSDDIFRPMLKSTCKGQISSRYGLSNDFILYLGGFSPRKNISRLVEAFNIVSTDLKDDIKLVIIGEPSRSYTSLISLCHRLNIQDRVVFIGFVPKHDLPLFYNACECFVYPSLYEGFGLPPLEAAACGAPSVVSNISSIPEVMEDCCTYVNPYDITSISDGIFRTVNNRFLNKHLRLKALKHSKKFSWMKATQETLEVYRCCSMHC